MERYVHIYLFTIAGLVALLIMTASAIAAPRVPNPDSMAVNPMIRTAGVAGCIRHARTATGEVLVNGCSQCLVVGVTRKRHGTSTPQIRKFNVLAGRTFPLPFRGPGKTSLGSIYPCDQANIVKPETLAKRDQTCIRLQTDQKIGAVYLVNDCRACRAASVVRLAGNGRPLGRQSYVIGAKSNLRLAPNGASQVGLLGEAACPRIIGR